MESPQHDTRYVPFVAMPIRAIYGAVLLLGMFLLLAALIARGEQACPVDWPARVQPIEGPVRPRPAPIPGPPTEDLDAREKRLLTRIREWVELRAERAEALAIEQVQEELLRALDCSPETMQGSAFAALFAARLADFIAKVLKIILAAAVVAVLISLLWTYWPWIAGVLVMILAALRLWIGAIVAKSHR